MYNMFKLFLILLFLNALKKSGIILFLEKSPPPITLPALAVTQEIPFFEKNES